MPAGSFQWGTSCVDRDHRLETIPGYVHSICDVVVFVANISLIPDEARPQANVEKKLLDGERVCEITEKTKGRLDPARCPQLHEPQDRRDVEHKELFGRGGGMDFGLPKYVTSCSYV